MVSKARQLYEFGPFRVDPDHRQLWHKNQPVPLQPKAFDILLVLVENSEKVVSKEDLIKTVWLDTKNKAFHLLTLRARSTSEVQSSK
jgi:DNA-binding winged helix-turn-helix (wHTH) protein